MRVSLIVLMMSLAACSSRTSSTETMDMTDYSLDTMAVAMDEAIDVIDTTYTITLEQESSFSAPQIDKRIAYVYSTTGLDVYATPGATKIGHLKYGDRAELTEPLVNNVPADTLTMGGLTGHYSGISYEGKPAYIFTGFLLNLPVPDQGIAVLDYCLDNLHLIKPGTKSSHECDCDSMSNEETFEFEHGITVSRKTYYESYDFSVLFRNRMTLQEAYLFSTYFFSTIAREFEEFPAVPFEEEKEGGVTVTVTAKGEYITSIVVATGEGCYEEEGIHEKDDHILMSANGGC